MKKSMPKASDPMTVYLEREKKTKAVAKKNAVPLDKLCVLLKELNESGYSFKCAFCKKAFPEWCDEKKHRHRMG